MQISESCPPSELVTTRSPPISSLETTTARQQPLVAMEVKMAEGGGVILPNDSAKGELLVSQDSSPRIHASTTPPTPLSSQSSSTPPDLAIMDLLRTSSDTRINYRGQGASDQNRPAQPLPAQPQPQQQPAAAHPQQTATSFQPIVPNAIVTRPVSHATGGQLVQGYYTGDSFAPPGFAQGPSAVPHYLSVNPYASANYSRAVQANTVYQPPGFYYPAPAPVPMNASTLPWNMPYNVFPPVEEDTRFLESDSPRAHQNPFAHRTGPIPTQSSVAFEGFVPSSCENVGLGRGRIVEWRIREEAERGSYCLPLL